MTTRWLKIMALVLVSIVAGLTATPSEARSHVSFGASFGHGGGWGGGWGRGYGYRPYWGPSFYWSVPLYTPAYYGYYGYDSYYYRPAYSYAPATYAPAYAPTYRGPGISADVTLGLFPSYVDVGSRERDLYYGAYREAMSAPVGNTVTWNGNTASGGVTTTRDGWAGQRYCREFRQTIAVAGRQQEAYGTACRDPNGDWQLVPNQR